MIELSDDYQVSTVIQTSPNAGDPVELNFSKNQNVIAVIMGSDTLSQGGKISAGVNLTELFTYSTFNGFALPPIVAGNQFIRYVGKFTVTPVSVSGMTSVVILSLQKVSQ